MLATIRTVLRRPAARLALAAAAATLAVGLGLPAGAPAGDAADRFVVGGPLVERVALEQPDAAAAGRLAASLAARLGFAAPASTRAERVSDRFTGTTYDEVTATDAAGRALSLQRFDGRGRLLAAVAFGWQSGGRPLADARAASARASRLAADLDLGASGSPTAEQLPDEGGWSVSWPRIVDGVTVVGDGVRIDLWQDGRLHAVVRSERPLAPRPPAVIGQAAARAAATAYIADRLGARSGALAIARLDLRWVAPNDAFDASLPDAPSPTLRLAWVVEARAAGDAAESLRAVRLYLDAGSGALIGGDVLR